MQKCWQHGMVSENNNGCLSRIAYGLSLLKPNIAYRFLKELNKSAIFIVILIYIESINFNNFNTTFSDENRKRFIVNFCFKNPIT